MKNDNFHLLLNIFCTLQFLIKEITTKPLIAFITQPDQNFQQTSTETLRNWNGTRTKCQSVAK